MPRPRLTAPIAVAALVGVLVAATPPPAPITPPAATSSPPVDTGLKSPKPPGTSRVLFVGDSVALALAAALSHSEVPYDVHIDNRGYLGCGIAIGSPRRFRGQDSNDPSFCPQWPQRRAPGGRRGPPGRRCRTRRRVGADGSLLARAVGAHRRTRLRRLSGAAAEPDDQRRFRAGRQGGPAHGALQRARRNARAARSGPRTTRSGWPASTSCCGRRPPATRPRPRWSI